MELYIKCFRRQRSDRPGEFISGCLKQIDYSRKVHFTSEILD